MAKKIFIGWIVALPKKSIENILINRKDIFVKYFSSSLNKKSKLNLSEGMYIYFYVSGGERQILGEARIKEIYFLNKEETLLKYKKRIFLNETDFKKYSKKREAKKAVVIQLGNIKKYEIPKRTKRVVNMGGVYLTKISKKEFIS